ncbi:MAG: hypothetical protein HFH49_18390 [Lachnospiraceae bacterium]|jgi:hypothetical protein|nr:hypothetical protein [Lachnospiraceae bacterium]
MDSVEIKQLVMENEKLRRELESVKYQKDLLVKAIAGRGGGEAEKILSAENQSLKDEITDLKNQLSVANQKVQETERLKAVIRELDERLSTLAKGRNWKKAVHQNIAKSMGVSAQALCYAVKGCSVKEIVQELNDEVTERTVYRALSVKEDTDLQRITTILHQFKEVFDSHDVTEDDVLKWFTGLRVKKLRLVTRAEVIRHFGEEALNIAGRDAYVQGEYYDMRGVRVQEQDCTSGEWGDC